jgi:undecaprenyl-diphosphatase
MALNYAVKRAVRRRRPQFEELPPLVRLPRSLSFPSAHAATSFAGATALGTLAPAFRAPLIAAATLMALTRPYLGLHYPSDVLAGALVGTGVGRIAARRLEDRS